MISCWCKFMWMTLFLVLQRDLGLQVKQKENGIFISQDKYVAEILKKFDFASIKMLVHQLRTHDACWSRDGEAVMWMYTFKIHDRLFREFFGTSRATHMGLWYPRVSSFDLEAYSDSDYARANLDRQSTTGGCQFLGRRLISWARQEADNCGYFFYRSRLGCCCQLLWASFVDSKSNVRLWVQILEHKIIIDNEEYYMHCHESSYFTLKQA
ncbi:hypothetical protein Tco_1353762 [Tanacetum coccineum]|uniref:Reverse transcriptase Ty1/copia-type domain-containing protein n=1 Tax=Tanacetum coccineum TaxID=301880 RepID=A0ABQ5HIM4_9ASTR